MVQYYEYNEFPSNVKRVIKHLGTTEYENYEMEVAKMEDGYTYAIATNTDTGYMFWTRGTDKKSLIHNCKVHIDEMIREMKTYQEERGLGLIGRGW